MQEVMTVWQIFKWTKVDHMSAVTQHNFCYRKMSAFALQVHSKQIRVQFLTWVTPPTFRIHSEVHIFVRFWKFWKFKYSQLQGHVTSRWFSGRQIFNLGWQKWWQRHIRFLKMVQRTQKPSFGRTKHKFFWNLACSTWRMTYHEGLPSGLGSRADRLGICSSLTEVVTLPTELWVILGQIEIVTWSSYDERN